MVSRRALLGVAAAAVAAPAFVTRGAARAATPDRLTVELVNNTGTDTVYAYVTGLDPAAGGATALLAADGATLYHPPSPGAPGAPLGTDCAIPVGANGATRTISLPHLDAGRVWFSLNAPMTFRLNPGPALVQPDATNPSDPNASVAWDFCEFTYNADQLYANITFVDFVSLPTAMSLTTGSGATQTVAGLPAGGLNSVCSALSAQGGDWASLIVAGGGGNLRALSPAKASAVNANLFAGYLDDYIGQVWSKYAGTDLVVNTQNAAWGTVTGRVSGGTLSFPGVGGFTQPSTRDVFSCSTGPFATGNDELGNLTARLAAALNRTTLLDDANQPDGENPANFYTRAQTNHYARILHATTPDHLGYAFPYDDVNSSSGGDLSGKVQAGDPQTWTITLGRP